MMTMKRHMHHRLSLSNVRWIGIWVGWFIISFVVAQFASVVIVKILQAIGIMWPVQTTMGALWFRVLIYSIFVALLVVAPYLMRKRLPSASLVGLHRPMEWKDILLAIAGMVMYLLLAAGALWLARLVPGFDISQAQDVGVDTSLTAQRIPIFMVLVVITPFFEEFMFRGFLYGRLRQHRLSTWVSALVVSGLFAIAHMQWNVGIDVFCLSLVACYLREITGTIWPGVILHMIKNGLAFYALILATSGAMWLW